RQDRARVRSPSPGARSPTRDPAPLDGASSGPPRCRAPTVTTRLPFSQLVRLGHRRPEVVRIKRVEQNALDDIPAPDGGAARVLEVDEPAEERRAILRREWNRGALVDDVLPADDNMGCEQRSNALAPRRPFGLRCVHAGTLELRKLVEERRSVAAVDELENDRFLRRANTLQRERDGACRGEILERFEHTQGSRPGACRVDYT